MPCLFLLIAVGLPPSGFAFDFFGDRERGWYWFEENINRDLSKQEDKTEKIVQNKFDANEVMKELQKSIEEALNLAILMPTEGNIENYLRHQIKAFNLSQRFAENTKILQLKAPLLDYQIESPYHHHARIIKNQEDRKAAEQAVQELAMTHGLFFFFESHCPYCEVMAPNVLSFANKYGMHLIPVSIDGGVLKEFPEALKDNGMADTYNVTHLPALFAVNPKTEVVLKLANRVTSVTELEDVVLRYKLYDKDEYHAN